MHLCHADSMKDPFGKYTDRLYMFVQFPNMPPCKTCAVPCKSKGYTLRDTCHFIRFVRVLPLMIQYVCASPRGDPLEMLMFQAIPKSITFDMSSLKCSCNPFGNVHVLMQIQMSTFATTYIFTQLLKAHLHGFLKRICT